MRVSDKTDFLKLDEVKNYLRIEHALDNDYLTELMRIAAEQADNFLQNEFKEQDATGEWVDLPVPFSIKLACMKMIAAWFEQKTDGTVGINAGGVSIQFGEIPWSAERLLQPYRKLVGL